MAVTYVIVVNDNGELKTITEADVERCDTVGDSMWKLDVDGCIERVLDFLAMEEEDATK